MRETLFAGTVLGSLLLLVQVRAQDVQIMRESTAKIVKEAVTSSTEHLEAESSNEESTSQLAASAPAAAKQEVAGSSTKQTVAQRASARLTIEQMRRGGEIAGERLRREMQAEQLAAAAVTSPQISKPNKSAFAATPPAERQMREPEPGPQFLNYSAETAFIRLADGFDFPVGKPEAKGYYKARGFHVNGHLGEDWDGVGGGDTDLGDPIYSIGDGVVVFARDCHMGWGNVVIVRHAFRDASGTHNVDSLYGHLQKILVRRDQKVRRGEQIATLGNAHGLYDAHLHLEIRKNIEIGMSRAKFAQDFSNYYDPSQFILSHRHLQGGGTNYRVAMNTFTYDARIPWEKLKNYSHGHTGGGSSESAIALKKALASDSSGVH